jgi:hypothetical protein
MLIERDHTAIYPLFSNKAGERNQTSECRADANLQFISWSPQKWIS